MISASHNPYHDNGIKIIDHSGFKLPDEQEQAIEQDIFAWLDGESAGDGQADADEGLDQAYIDASGRDACRAGSADCGWWWMHRTARRRIWRRRCSSGWARRWIASIARRTARISICIAARSIWKSLRERVMETRADLGVAFDGDADRAMFISHSGKVVDGDAVMLVTALPLHARGRLTEVIATVMSNLGLEVALRAHGIGLVRTPVGDKYVLDEMVKRNAPLGGEQSRARYFPRLRDHRRWIVDGAAGARGDAGIGAGSGRVDLGIRFLSAVAGECAGEGAASAGGA